MADTNTVLALIDGALGDVTSPDAMRWKPDADEDEVDVSELIVIPDRMIGMRGIIPAIRLDGVDLSPYVADVSLDSLPRGSIGVDFGRSPAVYPVAEMHLHYTLTPEQALVIRQLFTLVPIPATPGRSDRVRAIRRAYRARRRRRG